MIEKILEQIDENTLTKESVYFLNEHGIKLVSASKMKEIVQEAAKDGGKDTNVPSNGWIPGETELPPMPKENPVFDNKPLELYLVTLATTEYPFRAFWTGKEFTDGFGKLGYVTAWQPLPAPYQKGEGK